MAVLEGPDFKISRGSMPPDPPRGSRLPALGPLFTKFLDPPLKGIARRDSATPSTIFLDPSAAAFSWSPRFSNSDRKDRQLNPKRKAAVLIILIRSEVTASFVPPTCFPKCPAPRQDKFNIRNL